MAIVDWSQVKSFAIPQGEMKKVSVGVVDVWSKGKKQEPYWGLKFTAKQANSTVCLSAVGSAPSVSLVTSTDNGETWSSYTVGNTITLTNVGDSVCFAAADGVTNSTFASSESVYNKFVMTGKIAASGDISSLRKNDKETASSLALANYCYVRLFINCDALTTAPRLPATTLGTYCYRGMFNYCTSLTSAPELPATTLAGRCYKYMFSDCTSLTTAPELPATTLAVECYVGMFNYCTSLTTAPELPATTLASNCYQNTFNYCTSLTTASELPATTLASSCYSGMFQDCSSLTVAPELPATTLANYCYQNMFIRCFNLQSVKVAFTEWKANTTNNWLKNVNSTGTFTCPSALGTDSTITRGASNCPAGWTVANV